MHLQVQSGQVMDDIRENRRELSRMDHSETKATINTRQINNAQN